MIWIQRICLFLFTPDPRFAVWGTRCLRRKLSWELSDGNECPSRSKIKPSLVSKLQEYQCGSWDSSFQLINKNKGQEALYQWKPSSTQLWWRCRRSTNIFGHHCQELLGETSCAGNARSCIRFTSEFLPSPSPCCGTFFVVFHICVWMYWCIYLLPWGLSLEMLIKVPTSSLYAF